MNILSFFFKKKSFESDSNPNQIHIQTPHKPEPIKYSGMLEAIRGSFKKLYKNRIEGTESSNFNFRQEGLRIGVYYGLTQYDGQINRNGIKGVSLILPSGDKFADLPRNAWKRYEKLSDHEGSKWYGYYDGEYVRVTIVKDKVLETQLIGFLNNVGEWISDSLYNIDLTNRVSKLNLPEREIEIQKAISKEYGHELPYCGKYMLAGASRYVKYPCVSFGYTQLEPDNQYNSKAVAVFTDNGYKVGYIAEKELNKFYSELKNESSLPLVIETHYHKSKLYGWIYTFAWDKSEYHYMVNQYLTEVRHVFPNRR